MTLLNFAISLQFTNSHVSFQRFVIQEISIWQFSNLYDFPNCIGLFWISESEEAWLKEKAGFYETPLSPVLSSGPKRLFATIKTEESARYNLIECLKVSSDGKFKILVQLKPGLNYLNFEFCRVVRHLVINCTSRYAQVEQSNKIKLVYICSSDSNGEFQVRH